MVRKESDHDVFSHILHPVSSQLSGNKFFTWGGSVFCFVIKSLKHMFGKYCQIGHGCLNSSFKFSCTYYPDWGFSMLFPQF